MRIAFTALFISFLTMIAASQGKNNSWREDYFAGQPLRIGNAVQFLFDDYVVEDKFGLKRIIGPVEKYPDNPLIISNDKPWELSSTFWGGAHLTKIIYDPKEKLYKGWYLTYRKEPGIETGHNYSTLYVESKDGLTWEKPELDLFLINGQKTNIILHKEKGTALLQEVILDTVAEDQSRRYVGLAKMIPPGEDIRCIVRMFSPDGKRWTLATNPILFRGASDSEYPLVQDDKRDRWLIFRRPPTLALANNKEDGFYVDRNNKRRISVTTSKNFEEWTYPRSIAVLDEVDDSKLTQVGNNMDIDGFQVIKYKDIFLGFLSLMDNLVISVPRHNHLMWSRDGLDWERLPERPLFIKNGERGEWDAGSIGNISLIPDGERIRIYYSGVNTQQGFYGLAGEKNMPRFSGTGLAFIGQDRFIGLQAGPEGGFLLTRQFILEGNRIEINCRSHIKNTPRLIGSLIKAELLQSPVEQLPAEAYPGFSIKDCDPIIAKDECHQVITWNGKSDLAKLHGKPVYIRFYIRNTCLYTFQVKKAY